MTFQNGYSAGQHEHVRAEGLRPRIEPRPSEQHYAANACPRGYAPTLTLSFLYSLIATRP